MTLNRLQTIWTTCGKPSPMRNRIAHGYFDINLEVVWDTVQSALPVLKIQLDRLG